MTTCVRVRRCALWAQWACPQARQVKSRNSRRHLFHFPLRPWLRWREEKQCGNVRAVRGRGRGRPVWHHGCERHCGPVSTNTPPPFRTPNMSHTVIFAAAP